MESCIFSFSKWFLISYSSKPNESVGNTITVISPPNVDYNASPITLVSSVNEAPANKINDKASEYIKVVFQFLLEWPSKFLNIIFFKFLSNLNINKIKFKIPFSKIPSNKLTNIINPIIIIIKIIFIIFNANVILLKINDIGIK